MSTESAEKQPTSREFLQKVLKAFPDNEVSASELWQWYLGLHGKPAWTSDAIRKMAERLTSEGMAVQLGRNPARFAVTHKGFDSF